MKSKNPQNPYPENWAEIAKQVKEEANWECLNCGQPNTNVPGLILTVHHLDRNPKNNEWWNLVALCQSCHLHIQAKIRMEEIDYINARWWRLPYWLRIYVAGHNANLLGMRTDKSFVKKNKDTLLGYNPKTLNDLCADDNSFE